VVLAAIALAGLLFAVGGLTPVAPALDNLPGRLVLDLPDWLAFPFIVLMCLSAVFIALLLASGRRPQLDLRQARKRAAMAQVALLAVVLLFARFREHLGIDLNDMVRRFTALAGPPDLETLPDASLPPAAQSAMVSGLMEGLLLALAFFAFAVLAWLYLVILPQRGRAAPPPFDAHPLHAAVEESLDDLRNLPDARLAIIRCYDRFEKVLAAADVRRLPWQTVLEFMPTALKHPRLPDASVRDLTRLFEVARFSRHELGPEHRERAWQALMAVKAVLEEEQRHVPTS
jgi:hypothetical protein